MWAWNSDPFGTDAANASPSGAGVFLYDLRFPGQVFDRQAGLHQNGFREYDPAMGRYVESDPIGVLSGVDTYAYAESKPIVLGGASPKPCDCTVLGIYLTRKVSAFPAEPRESHLDARTEVVGGRDCRTSSPGDLQTEIRPRR
jgi:RHS repeat-associated protein